MSSSSFMARFLGWLMTEGACGESRSWCSDQLGVGIVETLLDLRELRRGQVDEVNAVCHPLEPDIPDRCQVVITRMLIDNLLEDHLRLVLGVNDFHSGLLGRKVARA